MIEIDGKKFWQAESTGEAATCAAEASKSRMSLPERAHEELKDAYIGYAEAVAELYKFPIDAAKFIYGADAKLGDGNSIFNPASYGCAPWKPEMCNPVVRAADVANKTAGGLVNTLSVFMLHDGLRILGVSEGTLSTIGITPSPEITTTEKFFYSATGIVGSWAFIFSAAAATPKPAYDSPVARELAKPTDDVAGIFEVRGAEAGGVDVGLFIDAANGIRDAARRLHEMARKQTSVFGAEDIPPFIEAAQKSTGVFRYLCRVLLEKPELHTDGIQVLIDLAKSSPEAGQVLFEVIDLNPRKIEIFLERPDFLEIRANGVSATGDFMKFMKDGKIDWPLPRDGKIRFIQDNAWVDVVAKNCPNAINAVILAMEDAHGYAGAEIRSIAGRIVSRSDPVQQRLAVEWLEGVLRRERGSGKLLERVPDILFKLADLSVASRSSLHDIALIENTRKWLIKAVVGNQNSLRGDHSSPRHEYPDLFRRLNPRTEPTASAYPETPSHLEHQLALQVKSLKSAIINAAENEKTSGPVIATQLELLHNYGFITVSDLTHLRERGFHRTLQILRQSLVENYGSSIQTGSVRHWLATEIEPRPVK